MKVIPVDLQTLRLWRLPAFEELATVVSGVRDVLGQAQEGSAAVETAVRVGVLRDVGLGVEVGVEMGVEGGEAQHVCGVAGGVAGISSILPSWDAKLQETLVVAGLRHLVRDRQNVKVTVEGVAVGGVASEAGGCGGGVAR